MNDVQWPRRWQPEAIAAVLPHVGTDDRLEIVVGDPGRSIHGSVLAGHLYLDGLVPTMIHDRSGRPDVYPWPVSDGPVLRVFLVRPRRKKLVLFADERWQPPS